MNTTDLADFGYIEIRETINLLNAWMKHGLPEDFEEDEVQVMFNPDSGMVFLTNSNYQVAMLYYDELESFYTCVECGREGFQDEFEKDSDCKGCREIASRNIEKEEIK